MALEDLLVCPVCHAELPLDAMAREGAGRCEACRTRYAHRSGAYDLTPNPPPDPDVREKWHVWEQLQSAAEVFYTHAPEENLSVGPRDDARAFARFSNLSGAVLDIGCGPQAYPSYGELSSGRLVGIDPLPGQERREFEFVQGIGEYLPFRDGTFDHVVFGATLDHMLSPRRVLAETARVLRPAGQVEIWFGEVPHSVPGIARRAAGRVIAALSRTRRRLRDGERGPDVGDFDVPEGAVDQFHFFHLDREMVAAWLDEIGFEVAEEERLGLNRFVRGRRSPAGT